MVGPLPELLPLQPKCSAAVIVSSYSFEQAEITKITTMLMIILIIIFFIIPHFDEVKFRRTETLPSFILFVKNVGILLGGCLTVKN